MKQETQIFKTWSEFYNRENKDLNGVSEEFAKEFPNSLADNETNKGCWNCSRCSGCSDCSDCSRCSDCSGCSGCSGCSRCSGCSDCSGCSGCSGCSRCSDCSRCSGLKNSAPVESTEPVNGSYYPVIENIHQAVLDAVNRGALKMDSWHESEAINSEGAYCGTTHCRAGWVVALAGKEGRELEKKVGTSHAAMSIYFASSPEINVSPVRFHESNEVAMADIIRCAELEKEKSK